MPHGHLSKLSTLESTNKPKFIFPYLKRLFLPVKCSVFMTLLSEIQEGEIWEHFENRCFSSTLRKKKVSSSHHPLLSLSYNLPCFSSLDRIWPIMPTYQNSSRKFLLIRRFSENLSSSKVETRLQISVDSHKRDTSIHTYISWVMQHELFYFHFGNKTNSRCLMDDVTLCVPTKLIARGGGELFYFYTSDNARSCVRAKRDNSANSTDKFILCYEWFIYHFLYLFVISLAFITYFNSLSVIFYRSLQTLW
jgi:hypothetical protein